jgi:carbon storage regulator
MDILGDSSMLVLSRKKKEKILIGKVVLTVVEIRGDKVKIGIEASKEIGITRPDMIKGKPDEPK